MANAPEIFTAEPGEAYTEVDAGAAKHVEPTLMGLAPYQWVSIAMLVLLLIAFFGAKVRTPARRGDEYAAVELTDR